jgi:hypothetical protein
MGRDVSGFAHHDREIELQRLRVQEVFDSWHRYDRGVRFRVYMAQDRRLVRMQRNRAAMIHGREDGAAF